MAKSASGSRTGRLLLAALASVVVGLTLTPAALADVVIKGTIKSAKSHAPIAGVEVEYFYEKNGYYKSGSPTTSNGRYEAATLPAGEYVIEFVPKAPYAYQYYSDRESYETATRVRLAEGQTEEINPELDEGNSIEGTVTSAASGEELPSIEVTLYEAHSPDDVITTVTTNEHGDYELTTIPRGEYLLGFRASALGGLNYAPQFFENHPRFDEATVLDLTEGDSRNVSPKMLKGGSITGTVTDAVTHAPVGGIVVYAFLSGENSPVAVAVTAANGTYTLPGFGSVSVAVVFAPESKEAAAMYLAQLYDGRELPEGIEDADLFLLANPVSVTAGVATQEINAAMVRREPANTSAPVVSGTPAVGQTLSCANGSWTGIPTIVYTQRWLREGVAIAGASSSAYVVQAADVGHGLACQVTATNELASVSATSNTLVVPSPSSPQVPSVPVGVSTIPVVVLSSARLTVSGGYARVPISCTNAACAGTIELTEQVTVKVRKSGHTRSEKKTVILARGSYALAAGHSATIRLHLNTAGKDALAKASHRRLSVEAVATVGGGKTARRASVLSQHR